MALMERARILRTSSAKASSGQHEPSLSKYPTQSLYAQYKDDLVMVLLASNLALIAYVAFSSRSNGVVKYAEVHQSSGDENRELL